MIEFVFESVCVYVCMCVSVGVYNIYTIYYIYMYVWKFHM